MSSRDTILSKVKQAQPERIPLIDLPDFEVRTDLIETFTAVATGIGSKVVEIKSLTEIKDTLIVANRLEGKLISTLPELQDIADTTLFTSVDPHDLEDVDLAIIRGHFGVAENSAIWVTNELLGQRVVPFIAQHLAIVIKRSDLLANMHQAYDKIGGLQYEFGTFIAGPSKTADIEQSLVLGAHGPRSLIVFILDEA
jgi:L-lactate dehydrogenase complex protein LldG